MPPPSGKGTITNQNGIKEWNRYGDERRADPLRWKKLLAAALTHGKMFSIGIAELDPGQTHLEHYHKTEFMVYLIIRGRGKAYLDGQAHSVSAGSVIYAPPTIRHKLVNTGRNNLVFFWITDESRLNSLTTIWTD